MINSALSRITFATLLMTSIGLSQSVTAQDRPDHYQGEAVSTLSQAVVQLEKYNAELEQLVAGELSPNAMAKIHELTYSIEVALAKVNDEFAQAAVDLEEVHLGSEELNSDRVQENAKAYLERTGTVLK